MNRTKIILSLLLIAAAAIVFAVTRESRPPASMGVAGPGEDAASSAAGFTAELLKLADRGHGREFLRRCHNPEDPMLKSYFREMRRAARCGFTFGNVQCLARQREIVLVPVTGNDARAFVCSLRRDEAGTNWNFLSFLPEDGFPE